MRTHHHKGAQGALQQQPRNNTFQSYNNKFYFLEVYPTTLYKCILHVYMYKKRVPSNIIRLTDFFRPPTSQMHFFFLPLQWEFQGD